MGMKKPPLSVVAEGQFQRGEVHFVFKMVLKFTGRQKESENPTLQPWKPTALGLRRVRDEWPEPLKDLKLGSNRIRSAF